MKENDKSANEGEVRVFKKDKYKRSGLSTFFFLPAIIVAGIFFGQSSYAGKHPYPELIDYISHEVVEILKKNGMPVRHDREDPWFKHSAKPGSYTLVFYSAEDIPQGAKLETIRLCMDLYQKRGKKEQFTLIMYKETPEEKHKWFSGVKPFFVLTIGRDN